MNKRINLGKVIGINVSKSGLSPSVRSKRGTISKKGYSNRTGIPGVTYRKSFSSKNSGCLVLLSLFIAIIAKYFLL